MLLCSADHNVRERWQQGLTQASDIVSIQSVHQLEMYLKTHPDELVLLHLATPDLEGIDGVVALRKKFPYAKIMTFADIPNDHEALALLRFGVKGYSNVYLSPELLTRAVKVVDEGEIWMGRKLMQRLVESLAKINLQLSTDNALHRFDELTEQERKICELVAEGACNKIIANKLDICERTVKTHLTSIFKKTHAHNRLELAMLVHCQPDELLH